MPFEDNGVVNPNANDNAEGVNSNNTNGESNSGNRADTSRVDATNGGGNNTNNNGAKKVFTFEEDRKDWVPRHAFNERLSAAEKRATNAAEQRFKQELEDRDRKIRLLAGVDAPNKEEADSQEVKEALARLGIKPSDPDREAKLERVLAAAEAMETEVKTRYEQLASEQMGSLHDAVSDLAGVELTDRQKTKLTRAYRDEAEACMQARTHAAETGQYYDASNDFLTRHQRRDPKLIQEMAKEWVEDWFEPARRSVTNQTVQRQFRPVPRGGNSRPVIVNRQKPDLSKPGAFEDALLAARSDEGNGFGGR